MDDQALTRDDAPGAALRLTMSHTSDAAQTGGDITVTAELRHHGPDELRLSCLRHVDVQLVGADGLPALVPGWRTVPALEEVLAPGQAVRLVQDVELRGPRGGAARAPLRPGRYLLTASLEVAVDGEQPRTLRSDGLVLDVTPASEVREGRDRVLEGVGDEAQEAAGGPAVADPVVEDE